MYYGEGEIKASEYQWQPVVNGIYSLGVLQESRQGRSLSLFKGLLCSCIS
jgi:hypothetical protein